MQTKPKSNSVVTHERTPEGGIVFKVKDAGGPGVPGEFTFNPAQASDANRTRAMLHGFVQRISDAAAISRDTTTGKPATPEVKLAAMRRLADHYASGSEDWSLAREASAGPGLDRLILAAVCEATGKDEAAVRTLVAEGSAKHSLTQRAYLEALGGGSKVKPILERMRAEQAKSVTFDPDAELDEATKG